MRIFLLQGLHFSQNKLKRLEPESREGLDNLKFFKNAEVIDLEDNELESIGMTEGSEQFWKLFRSTDTLRLSYNRISSIGPCALKPLVSLTSLDLASNRLEELPECLSILSGEFLYIFNDHSHVKPQKSWTQFSLLMLLYYYLFFMVF